MRFALPMMPHAAHGQHYRPDLDGLRALAVVLVLGYHFELPGLSGGFVGVDVFFVISGYLMALLNAGAIGQGAFSPRAFLARRLWRLAPAYFLVLAAIGVIALFVLSPRFFADFGRDLWPATLFASNIALAQQASYFDATAEQRFLLHTWSLGVEMQFYLVFAAAAAWISAKRLPRGQVFALLMLAFGVSFALAVWFVREGSGPAMTAFFHLPFRLWEFGIGVVAGLLPAANAQGRLEPRARSVLAALGALAILAPAFLLDGQSPFPGLGALAPCCGAATILVMGRNGAFVESPVNRLLATRPAQPIGAISYSLYLWHWPLAVALRWAGLFERLDARLVMLVLSFGLAWLTWRFIEQPFRLPKVRPRLAAAGLMATMVLLLALSGAIIGKKGFPDFLMAAHEAATPQAGHALRACDLYLTRTNALPEFARCRVDAARDAPIDALLIGDSHAAHFIGAFREGQGSMGINLAAITRYGCPPMLHGTVQTDTALAEGCLAFYPALVARISASPAIKTVILAGRWDLMTRKKGFFRREAGGLLLRADANDLHDTTLALVRALQQAGKMVIVVNQIPLVSPTRIRCIGALCLPRYASARPYTMPLMDKLAKAASAPAIMDFEPAYCLGKTTQCAEFDAFYVDESHISVSGSAALGREAARLGLFPKPPPR